DAGYDYDTWEVATRGAPDLSGYDTVIYDDGYGMSIDDSWNFVDDYPDRVDLFRDFMLAGGSMYICGPDVAWTLLGSPEENTSVFLTNYLHANLVQDDTPVTSTYGVTGDAISDGLSAGIAENGGINIDSIDSLEPVGATTEPIFYDVVAPGPTDNCTGVRYEHDTGLYRSVLTTFNLCQYGDDYDRQVLIGRILQWLVLSPLDHDATVEVASHQDGYAYYNGLQDVVGTVSNPGLSTEAPFNVQCIITRLDPPDPPTVFLDEDFEGDGSPTYAELGWTMEHHGENDADRWKLTTNPTGFDHGSYQNEVDSSATFPVGGAQHDEWIVSPSLDFTDYDEHIYLQFWHNYDYFIGDRGYVDISLDDGVTWPINVITYASDQLDTVANYDISPHVADQNTVKIRWRYTAPFDCENWNVDDVLIQYSAPYKPVEVLNQDLVTVSLAPGEEQQLTWSYDFTIEDYWIEMMTKLPGDERSFNNYTKITIDIVAPPQNDARVDSIDTHVDQGTYLMGAQDIKATVSNQGTDPQGPFDVNCTIYKYDLFPYTEHYVDDMESLWTHSDLESAGDLWQQDATHAISGATGWFCGNLLGEYEPFMDNVLTSGVIDLSAAWTPLYFSFFTDYDVEGSTYDNMHVEINSSSGWNSIDDPYTGYVYYPHTTGDESTGWGQKVYDISTYAGESNVQIRFRFKSDSSIGCGDGDFGTGDISGNNQEPWEGVYVDAIKIYNNPTAAWNYAWGGTQTTPVTLNRNDTQQLTWNYNFDTET
ncbi:MAG: hypothetical protein KAT70_03840, partial [Thermoplasmata archaeon]|nr:hypothetical protein [Thermoplasmata archaeon]